MRNFKPTEHATYILNKEDKEHYKYRATVLSDDKDVIHLIFNDMSQEDLEGWDITLDLKEAKWLYKALKRAIEENLEQPEN